MVDSGNKALAAAGNGGSDLDAKVSRQVEAAVTSADVVLFVVDASGDITFKVTDAEWC